ncbi:MAG: ispD [Acidobacteria bacterium]|jgi:2-C-methyl-D-erythritol 4-phosphate cytidylyltransferase|nr:ispD [Acidobacteriota bacterium]
MNSVIIVAAGSGTRFGGGVPKQFLEIHGKPVIVHTLERFENCRAVDEIILVLSSREIENFQKTIGRYDLKKLVKIVAGGQTRAESVLNGLNAVNAETTEVVAVHDGARPLVSRSEIERTIEKARETGAACLAAKVTDTIKEVSGDKIVGTIDRSHLRRALTPQAFRFDVLRKAYAQNDAAGAATDECFLVEKSGYEITVVEGNARNIKITHPEDLKMAEFLFSELED